MKALSAPHRADHDRCDSEVELETEKEGDGAPLVTVAVSLYNYGDYIIKCLDSVRAQTFVDLDLIVTDDCSKDHSLNSTRLARRP